MVKKLTEKKFMLMKLELEQAKIEREKSVIALDRSLFLYFIFLFAAILGFINGFANLQMLNTLVVLGIAVLIIGSIPYLKSSIKEKNILNQYINTLKHG